MLQKRGISVVRAGTSVLTASRVEGGSGFVRVMGPGKTDVKGMCISSSDSIPAELHSDMATKVSRFVVEETLSRRMVE